MGENSRHWSADIKHAPVPCLFLRHLDLFICHIFSRDIMLKYHNVKRVSFWPFFKEIYSDIKMNQMYLLAVDFEKESLFYARCSRANTIKWGKVSVSWIKSL